MTPMILTELRRRGIAVAVVGGKLRLYGPKGVITPDLASAVARDKGRLLTLLTASCRVCGWTGGWISRHGQRLCGRCHPDPERDPLVTYAETTFCAPVVEIRPNGTPLAVRLAGRPWRSKMAGGRGE